MISIDNITLSFGGFELFKGFSFQINLGDRIGLVGKNGAGKSTLMKMIGGEQSPSSGRITLAKDLKLGYLPQHLYINDTQTVMEEVATSLVEMREMEQELDYVNQQLTERTDYESNEYADLIERSSMLTERVHMSQDGNQDAEIEQTLIGLGFERGDFTRHTSEFSGGWRMRVELAKIILQKPDVFLLDEPTNHLDIESIQWLEDFLKKYKGAIVLVSHDRAFLDNITNRTVEISLGRIYDYKANYTNYLEQRQERRATQLAAYQNQQKLIKETEDFIERFRYKASKAVQVQSRVKMLEKIERLEVDEEDNSRLNLKFPPAQRSGDINVETKDLNKSYGSLHVLHNVNVTVMRGEKIAFVGKNGAGKTTLARIILGQLEYESGSCRIGHNVEIGYFAQNQADLLDESLSVLETVDHIAVGDIRTKLRDILGAFMFSGEDVDKKVRVLSGGEKTRLALACMLLEPFNLLVLDEPTNHLDMRTKDILKQALREYNGTVILVSHDREFLDGLVDCVYEFDHMRVRQHIGTIYEFLEKKKLESFKELEKKAPQIKDVKPVSKGKKPVKEVSYNDKKQIMKEISRLEKSVQQSEIDIEKLEAELMLMEKDIADSNSSYDADMVNKYEKTKNKLENRIEEWETLSESLSEAASKKTW
ncbi:MAG: ABC-F family ATP-binding cassette domain-containing protein [Bacteroidales bacterium]